MVNAAGCRDQINELTSLELDSSLVRSASLRGPTARYTSSARASTRHSAAATTDSRWGDFTSKE